MAIPRGYSAMNQSSLLPLGILSLVNDIPNRHHLIRAGGQVYWKQNTHHYEVGGQGDSGDVAGF